ncbi:hypothetical protein [Tabrizicola sp.]|uniref:hypothetical protein n=1 Tax=Tabrizicola sp. TaxID=2005166 RepID=UPI0035B0F8E8
MTESVTTRLRLFFPDDFAAPQGWPEDVGIVALQVGDAPEIFPFHRRESPEAILSRIETLTTHRLAEAAVFPPVEGHPVCDLPFTAVARLRLGIESFLARSPDAVEEAADFSVNFGFAVDEGLDLAALVRVPDPQTESDAPRVTAELPGYAPFQPLASPGRIAIPALLVSSPTGELAILIDPEAAPVAVAPSDVLVRDDGLALALRRSAFDGQDLPGSLLLPPDCLGIRPPATGLPALIMPQDRHYLVTPVYEAPVQDLPDPATPPAPTGEETRSFGRLALQRSFAAVACILAAAVALALLPSGTTRTAEQDAAPLHALRAGLFQ